MPDRPSAGTRRVETRVEYRVLDKDGVWMLTRKTLPLSREAIARHFVSRGPFTIREVTITERDITDEGGE